jgi:hypothetical protein
MSKKFAEIISLIFDPLVVLMPVPFFLVFEKTNNLARSLAWSGISTFFIFLYFILIVIGIRFGIFSDMDLSRREQRPIAFLVGIFLTISYLIILFLFHSPGILQIGTFALILGVIVIGIANRFTKVSWHLAVLSAFLTSIVLIEGWMFLGGFILLPLLAWARIKTKNHTLLQTVLGSVMGILTTVIVYVIVKYIVG